MNDGQQPASSAFISNFKSDPNTEGRVTRAADAEKNDFPITKIHASTPKHLFTL
jgi:hypothetical protein